MQVRQAKVKQRTAARELALKALYQYDLLGCKSAESAREYCLSFGSDERVRFARELLEGCISHLDELDETIDQTAEHWNHARMPVIDRNVLRLGVYELTYHRDTPPKVSINEAIELAKKYSTSDSASFVNGVLDRIYAKLDGQSADENGDDEEEEDCGEDDPPGPDPEARADLHVHSTASDGSVEPEDLPEMAAKAGLSAIALTDHDALEGIEAAREAAEEAGVELVPGVELTAYAPRPDGDGQIEVHILGLFIDPADPGLNERLERLREVRVERIRRMSAKLQDLGCSIKDTDVLARGAGAVGRMHLAQEMVEQGICSNIREAFNEYIGMDGPAYVPKEQMTPEEAVRLVRGAGGCAVFAHPGLTEDAERLIEELADAGLGGIEVHYPFHNADQERDFMEQARRLGLAMSGGSDFHGDPKPDVRVGMETISMVDVEGLREASAVKTRS